jgi:hypothetical protein
MGFDIAYAYLYSPVYILVMFVLSLYLYNSWKAKTPEGLLYEHNTDFFFLLFFVVLLAFLIGNRPQGAGWFGDTGSYKHIFNLFKERIKIYSRDESEWFFYWLMYISSKVMSVADFFTLVSVGYFGFMMLACHRLFQNNAWGAMLFLLGAFSTFSYATNGIRNGLACSMILYALSLAVENKRGIIIGGIIAVYAIAIHKTAALPVVCFAAAYFQRSTKYAIYFWIFSIGLNLVAHGAIESFFSGFVADERMASYVKSTDSYAQVYKSGFRPDFLLYSAMPVWMAYYVLVKKGIQDITYSFIANTYIYANAFWVMMMQASYSNRFAYLSWFMLPIVLAYPCLRMNVWGEKQGYVAATVLILHTGFTAFMEFIYY